MKRDPLKSKGVLYAGTVSVESSYRQSHDTCGSGFTFPDELHNESTVGSEDDVYVGRYQFCRWHRVRNLW